MIVWNGMDLVVMGVLGVGFAAWLLWLFVIWIRAKFGKKS